MYSVTYSPWHATRVGSVIIDGVKVVQTAQLNVEVSLCMHDNNHMCCANDDNGFLTSNTPEHLSFTAVRIQCKL